MGFSRQEYWSGLAFPSPGDLPNPDRLCLLHWQVDSLPLSRLESLKEILLLLFSLSVMSDSLTPWTAAHQASLTFTVS